MSVSKFYAIAAPQEEDTRIINAFEALELIENYPQKYPTKPMESSVFYDLENGLKVSPSIGRINKKTNIRGQAFFKYYSSEENALKGREGSFHYTPELIAFLTAFEHIKKFQIEYDNKTVILFPSKIEKMKRILFNDDFCILKFFINLELTYPYSEYYKFNGVFAIEFYVESKPSRLKRAELAGKGIPLFEAKAQFPKRIQNNLPKEFSNSQILCKIANEIRETYQNRNYKLFGNFKKKHSIFPEFERKYHILKQFESQCDELKINIKNLNKKFEKKKEEFYKLSDKINSIKHYLIEIDNNNKTYEQNKQLLKENTKLRIAVDDLETEIKDYKQKLKNTQEELTKIRGRSFLERLFNK